MDSRWPSSWPPAGSRRSAWTISWPASTNASTSSATVGAPGRTVTGPAAPRSSGRTTCWTGTTNASCGRCPSFLLARHSGPSSGWPTNSGCEELGVDIAADLVDASLLVRADTPSGSRYTQLETLRTFGLDRLDHGNETADARDLTARWLCRLLDELRQNLRPPEEPVWVDRVRREFANIREIRAHLVAHERWEEALDIAVGLNSWSRMRDATEVWSWADGLADAFVDGPDHLRSRSLVLLSHAEWRRGNIVGTAEAATAALEASNDEWTAGRAQAELGVAKLFSGDFAGAEKCWITSARLIGDGVSSCTAAIAAA